jgi:hypothetical protein
VPDLIWDVLLFDGGWISLRMGMGHPRGKYRILVPGVVLVWMELYWLRMMSH